MVLKLDETKEYNINNFGVKCKECGKEFLFKDLLKKLGTWTSLKEVDIESVGFLTHQHIMCHCGNISKEIMLYIEIKDMFKEDAFELVYRED